jgi:succinyl-diaminopimelate desuccinylase
VDRPLAHADPGPAMDAALDATALLECARELVRVPSENPPGDERAAAAAIRPHLEAPGCQVAEVEPAPGRVSLVATLDSGRPGPTLAVNGHLDVVPAGPLGAWEHPPYEAAVADGVLHGRGACDMKGAIAAAIHAAKALVASGAPWHGRLAFQLVADEETLGPHGTRALLRAGLVRADAAVVAEPTGMRVAIAERGAAWYRVRTIGKAAHGSRPADGISAIAAMAKLVPALLDQTWERTHPLVGVPSVNVGTIRGGDKINMVPAWCEIEVDRRTLPGETADQVTAELEAIVERLQAADPGFHAKVQRTAFEVACEVEPDAPIVRAATSALAGLDMDTDPIGMSGATDARILQQEAGVPAIVLGPGDLSLAHSTAERVPVADLLTAARAYARLYTGFLAPATG